MPLQMIEPEVRRVRSTPMTVTLSVAKNGQTLSGRLSSTALAYIRSLTDAPTIRIRIGLDGKRVALVVDPNGREVSQSGSFPGYELSKALGGPSASVKHSVTASVNGDGFAGLWLGSRIEVKRGAAAKA